MSSPAAAPDVIVVGAGIIGLACARALAGRGLAVEVLERGTGCGEASTAAAGMLAPLAEVPEPGPMLEACRASRDLWRTWAAELEAESGENVDHDTSGTLSVARTDDESAWLDRLLAAARRLGEPAEEMPLEEARRRVPDLSADVRRVLHLPGEHRVDNERACAALLASVEGRGVAVRRETHVEEIAAGRDGVTVTGTTGGPTAAPWRRRAPAVLVAAGAWSGRIRGLQPLPVGPVRGQMLRLAEVDWPWRGVVRAGHHYAVRRAGGRLLVGATVERSAFHDHPTPAGLAELLEFLRCFLPGLGQHPLDSVWAGLRPGTPDGLPLVGPLPHAPGVWIATGHFRNGILLAPWTAERLAAALDAQAVPELASFSPGRFR
ncbi:MAG TPA: glycine oxidase ThiO [Thermoanaerobaculia bacterium]|nr:glycine oxidase ThiO [Thermoanaerobaculia bacterium]